MCPLSVKGTVRRGESVGQRKDFRTHQQVSILGSDRMPINTIGGDGDFRYKIGTRQCDPLRRKSAKGDSADDPILFADLTVAQEFSELFGLSFGCDARGQAHPKPLGSRLFYPPPRFGPSTGAAVLIVAFSGWTVEADLQCHAFTR